MEFHISNRMSTIRGSAIREIFKAAADPSVISLAGGNPAPELFPNEQLGEIAADLLKNQPVLSLQYGVTEGYTPLREAVKARLKEKEHIDREGDDVIIVSSVSPFPAARVHSAVAPTIRTPLRMEARLKYGPPIPKAASAVGPRNAPVRMPSMTAVTAPESSATSIVSMVFWNSFRRMYSSLIRSIGAPFVFHVMMKSGLTMHRAP